MGHYEKAAIYYQKAANALSDPTPDQLLQFALVEAVLAVRESTETVASYVAATEGSVEDLRDTVVKEADDLVKKLHDARSTVAFAS